MLILSLVFVATIGFLAQTTGLCMVRGVKEAVSGKPVFLLSILLSGTLVWVAIAISYWFEYPVNYSPSYPTLWAAAGGLIFGMGAAFNGGCGVSTISRFARGQIVMFATVAGWLVAWLALADILKGGAVSSYPMAVSTLLGILIVVSVVLLVLAFRSSTETRNLWLSMLGIGLMAGLVFIYEPHWTPSGLFKSMGLSLWNGQEESWPRVERFYLFAFLVIGMVVAALVTSSFKFESTSVPQVGKHFAAGIMMGIGAVMAGGGNDTQLLVSLPSLSLAGLVTTFSIVVGIWGVVSFQVKRA
ncbi:YeeE/YedE family protein [Vibrio hangzhouensis]|uniref:YeeE/YedE family protein n=1 Tax=Vibrio hangzhouensis TaxID=462991 RepID=UPI0021BC1DE0|nr:YeeE/YedE family protein [Vibrio hangzhouensis]